MNARQIATLFEKTRGKAWEPRKLDSPFIADLIARGYLKRCAMRCGFEAFDTGVDWTEAGTIAAAALAQETSS